MGEGLLSTISFIKWFAERSGIGFEVVVQRREWFTNLVNVYETGTVGGKTGGAQRKLFQPEYLSQRVEHTVAETFQVFTRIAVFIHGFRKLCRLLKYDAVLLIEEK